MNRQEYRAEIDRVIEKGPYKDEWASLFGRTMPSWMHKGKLGIFIHWGAYAVPAFENEWYPRNMYIEGSKAYEHHIATYGPQKEFGYRNFIPMFKGENFDPEAWAELFSKAGARYCVPVAEHHDGFQMYASELSRWNAAEMGPKRNVLGELNAALDKRGIVRGASSHRIEHWFFLGEGRKFDSDVNDTITRDDLYWPSVPVADLDTPYGQPAPDEDFLEDWLVRCCEIVDKYQPLEFYFDWWIQHEACKGHLRKFAAYYYNRAAEWGKQVTICYKHDAFPLGTATVDVERGKFTETQAFQWQTCTAIARNSWGWTENNDFKPASALVQDLVDIVSKNGVMLLNVGPKPDGSISEQDKAVLLAIGDWLRENGEAVYDTIPWRKPGEGPTKTREGHFTDDVDPVFTREDIRFTEGNENVYATFLNWPEDGDVCIKSLAEKDKDDHPVFRGIVRDVQMLNGQKAEWKRDETGLHIRCQGIRTDMPVVAKIVTD